MATRESRVYYCQNWRGDVVALLGVSAGDFGVIRERVTYSSYGIPQGLPPGDLDNDADADAADETLWNTLSAGAYDVRADLDLDGDMDITDEGLITGAVNQGFAMGRGVLSRDNGLDYAVGNRKGYAGYEHDGVFNTMCHVRNRVLLTDLGRWSRRDPLGYVDGMGLYEYVGSRSIATIDTMGLQSSMTPDLRSRWRIREISYCVPGQTCVGNSPSGGSATPVDPQGPTTHPKVPTRGRPRGSPLSSPPTPPCSIPNQGGDACAQYRPSVCGEGGTGPDAEPFKGTVICDGPFVRTCVYDDPGDHPIVSTCIRRHELFHVEDVDCRGCAPGTICTAPLRPGKTLPMSECRAYTAEAACYFDSTSAGQCSGPECERAVCLEWLFACWKAAKNCGGNLPTHCMRETNNNFNGLPSCASQ